MVGESVEFPGAAHDAERVSAPKEPRERSAIDFPYLSMEAGIEVAKALYHRSGFGPCEQDELAAEMGQTISGAFRQKTAAARTFGLVDKDGRRAFVLTELGKRIVSAETESSARVDAFLSVPLYAAIYEKFRGHNLPPSKALEREMESLGVARKQTDRARQAFERSAQLAGFFEGGKERLIRPREKSSQGAGDVPSQRDQKREGSSGEEHGLQGNRGGGELPSQLDPIILGLIRRLPKAGSVWPKAKRKLWLQILENSFELVYEDNESNSNPSRNNQGDNDDLL